MMDSGTPQPTASFDAMAPPDNPPVQRNWPFDSDDEGFRWTVNNVGDATVTWIDTDGSPEPGAIRASIPYDGSQQHFYFFKELESALDLRGTTVSVRVKLETGFVTNNDSPGVMFLYASTTDNFLWLQSAPSHFEPGDHGVWRELRLDMDSPDMAVMGSVPSDAREVGVFIFAPNGTGYVPATVLIDSISIQ